MRVYRGDGHHAAEAERRRLVIQLWQQGVPTAAIALQLRRSTTWVHKVRRAHERATADGVQTRVGFTDALR